MARTSVYDPVGSFLRGMRGMDEHFALQERRELRRDQAEREETLFDQGQTDREEARQLEENQNRTRAFADIARGPDGQFDLQKMGSLFRDSELAGEINGILSEQSGDPGAKFEGFTRGPGDKVVPMVRGSNGEVGPLPQDPGAAGEEDSILAFDDEDLPALAMSVLGQYAPEIQAKVLEQAGMRREAEKLTEMYGIAYSGGDAEPARPAGPQRRPQPAQPAGQSGGLAAALSQAPTRADQPAPARADQPAPASASPATPTPEPVEETPEENPALAGYSRPGSTAEPETERPTAMQRGLSAAKEYVTDFVTDRAMANRERGIETGMEYVKRSLDNGELPPKATERQRGLIAEALKGPLENKERQALQAWMDEGKGTADARPTGAPAPSAKPEPAEAQQAPAPTTTPSGVPRPAGTQDNPIPRRQAIEEVNNQLDTPALKARGLTDEKRKKLLRLVGRAQAHGTLTSTQAMKFLDDALGDAKVAEYLDTGPTTYGLDESGNVLVEFTNGFTPEQQREQARLDRKAQADEAADRTELLDDFAETVIDDLGDTIDGDDPLHIRRVLNAYDARFNPDLLDSRQTGLMRRAISDMMNDSKSTRPGSENFLGFGGDPKGLTNIGGLSAYVLARMVAPKTEGSGNPLKVVNDTVWSPVKTSYERQGKTIPNESMENLTGAAVLAVRDGYGTKAVGAALKRMAEVAPDELAEASPEEIYKGIVGLQSARQGAQ